MKGVSVPIFICANLRIQNHESSSIPETQVRRTVSLVSNPLLGCGVGTMTVILRA